MSWSEERKAAHRAKMAEARQRRIAARNTPPTPQQIREFKIRELNDARSGFARMLEDVYEGDPVISELICLSAIRDLTRAIVILRRLPNDEIEIARTLGARGLLDKYRHLTSGSFSML